MNTRVLNTCSVQPRFKNRQVDSQDNTLTHIAQMLNKPRNVGYEAHTLAWALKEAQGWKVYGEDTWGQYAKFSNPTKTDLLAHSVIMTNLVHALARMVNQRSSD